MQMTQGVRILSLMEENKHLAKSERRAVQTSGLVGVDEAYGIALYVSGRHHSGENIKELLKGRPRSCRAPQAGGRCSPM